MLRVLSRPLVFLLTVWWRENTAGYPLDAGESRSFTLDFGIHLGNDKVGELINEATERQSSTALKIIKEPPATE